jgi:hypothetical protein
MTKDEIIEMAKQAGFAEGMIISTTGEVLVWDASPKQLEAFAKLVEDKVRQEIAEKNAPVIKKVNEHIKELQDAVKAEREACARLSITIPNPYKDCQISAHGYDIGILEYSRAIRARGNT